MIRSEHKVFKLVIFIIAVWFIFLCSMHLVQQRPLWNDEECVFRSVKSFTPQQMFGQALVAFQVFPRLYLFSIQQFSQNFDFSRITLRLPSFICMIAAFLLWLKIARYGLKDRWQYLAFVCSWPASGMLLYYSAELKQYSMDALAAALFILFLYQQEGLERKRNKYYIPLLILLPALGLFSYPAFVLAMLPLYNLVLSVIRKKINWKYIAVYAMSLSVFVMLSYHFDMRWRSTGAVTQGFDEYFISFTSVGEFFRSFTEGINNLFSRWFVESPKYFKSLGRIFMGWGLIYLFYGFFKNIKEERWYFRSLETIAFIVFLELFVLGCLKKYMFTVPRTSLFYAPIVLYLTVKGIGLAGGVHPVLYRLIMSLYFVFLGFLIVMQSIVAFQGRLGFYPLLW